MIVFLGCQLPEFQSCSKSCCEIAGLLVVRILFDEIVGGEDDESWYGPSVDLLVPLELYRVDEG